ncbi:MAG TPA: type II toxin-antitoxin system VapC family toxin [Vicinamibacterales bacterium]|jgi:predicted nucleic acid-binding protein|nr:type II toxin-antitoxin system VapC family toxin [Vicinamibacterales bacterium]
MTLYLDTSSLVKLYVEEPGSEAVRRLVAAATIVATSLVAYPEARAAFARRRREGVLRPSAFAAARRSLDADWPHYLAIGVSARLCREAGELAERYRLRGYDAVHLASFAELARSAGARDTRFSSFDDRLNRAAGALRRTLSRVGQAASGKSS